MQVYEENWSKLFTCINDCGESVQLPNLSPQTYHVNVQFLDKTWRSTCMKDIDIALGAFSATPSFKNAPAISTTVNLFPSPVVDQLFLQVQTPTKTPIVLQLINNLGQECHRQLIAPTDFTTPIDVSDLPKGFYLAQISQGGQLLLLEKFVKQ